MINTNSVVFDESIIKEMDSIAYETVYNPIKLMNFFATGAVKQPTPAMGWQTKYLSSFTKEVVGSADIVTTRSQDFPTVEMGKQEKFVSTVMLGVSAKYAIDELDINFFDVNLAAEKISAGIDVLTRGMERHVIEGSALAGFEGVFKNSNVPVVTNSSGTDWDTANGAQIVSDINEAMNLVLQSTNEGVMPNAISLPAKYHAKFNEQFESGIDRTILGYLQQNNIYTTMTGAPVDIHFYKALDTASVTNDNRFLVYEKNPRYQMMQMIITPRAFFDWENINGLMKSIPMVAVFGGGEWRVPESGVYVDGI